MIIINKFNLGDTVIVKTDKQRREMTVIGIKIYEDGLLYVCSTFEQERNFYGMELESVAEDGLDNLGGSILTVEGLKSLEFEEYLDLIRGYDTKTIEEIIEMLVNSEEYEMAEVTNNFLKIERKE